MRTVLALAMMAAVLCSNMAFAQNDGPPPVPTFPLIGLWGPPATEADFTAYRNAHFNIVPVTWGEGFDAGVKFARQLRMQVMIADPALAGGTPNIWASTAAQYDNVMGICLADPLKPEELPHCVEIIKQYRALDPTRFLLVTLPSRAQQPEWGNMIAQLTQAGIPLLCYSRPAFFEDGSTDENGYLQDIELTRRLAAQVKKPFWGVVYSTQHNMYRRAAESDLRFQAYAHLAAGARGLCYFTYWGPGPADVDVKGIYKTWGMPMVNPATGEPQYGYEKVEELNREILTLSPFLLELKSYGLYYAGAMPEGGKPLDPTVSPLFGVAAEKAMIGLFADKRANTWALLVNRRFGKQKSAYTQRSTMQVTLAPDVRRVVEIDRYTAAEKEIPIENNQFVITIPGGTGSLIRIELDKPMSAATPQAPAKTQ